jgi:hypothetical protein
MPDYYVALVKEYLELQNFVVRTETKFKIRKKDKRGIMRTSWGDIDILAIKIQDGKIIEVIVGEVKGEYQTEKNMQGIIEDKFENKHVIKRLQGLIGSSEYTKYLYCWSWTPKRREFAKQNGITPVSFSEIIDSLENKVDEHEGWMYLKDFPNLMLLQFLKSKKYLVK